MWWCGGRTKSPHYTYFFEIMEPIVFKTEYNNCYLYSPSKKALIPIPLSLYEELSVKDDSNDAIWLSLRRHGYLDIWYDEFKGVVDAKTIKDAVINLSQIVFETTTLCNLRCEYCCYGDGYNTFEKRRDQRGLLTFDTAKTIIDYLHTLFAEMNISAAPKEPFAISFYGGEPLINFNVIKEIVEYAENLNLQNRIVTFTMTTNATLLAKYADFLQSHQFKLLISLDGDKSHDAYRKTTNGKESFDIVIANLEKVKAKYPKWFSTFRFNAVYTNISHIEEIVTWFKEKFDKVPNFSPLHPPTIGSIGYDKILKMLAKFEIPESMMLDEDLIAQSPINKRVLELCNCLFSNTINKEYDLIEKTNTLPSGTCIPFSKRMFVSYDGKLHPCEKVNRDFPLGEIKDGQVKIDFKKNAEAFMQKLSIQKPICQKCYLQMCCSKCLYCLDYDGCDNFMSKRNFSSLLSQTLSYIEAHPYIVSLLKENIIIK